MFLPINNRRSANAYKTVGDEAAILGADAHQLIGLVFEAVLKSVREAKAALQRGDLSAKARAIGRAIQLIDEGLIAALNDARGGQMAANLRSLYLYSIRKLVDANIRSSITLVEEVEGLLVPVIDAWSEIRSQVIAGVGKPLDRHA